MPRVGGAALVPGVRGGRAVVAARIAGALDRLDRLVEQPLGMRDLTAAT
jgi:hypothetical protein